MIARDEISRLGAAGRSRRLGVAFLFGLAALCGCGSPDSSPPGRTSAAAEPGNRTEESATPIPQPDQAVSDDARERDLELGSAQKTDYLALQASLRSALSQADPSIAAMATYTDGTVTARDAASLLRALGSAAEGAVIFVPSDGLIDLTGHQRIEIPAGVTLASGRNVDRAKGALLFTNDPDATLFVAGAGSRVVGLDLMGPDPSPRSYQLERLYQEGGSDLYYAVPASIGIYSEADDVLVENCELWGWSNAAISLGPGAQRARIRHCFIHHNQRLRLGYGVHLDQADALLEANLFDWYRHCVAGSGRDGTSYEARFNYVLPNASGHAFDMHGGVDRNDGTDLAGDSILIHHNIVEAAQFPAVVIRGRPTGRVAITDNQFRNPDPARTIVLQGGAEGVVDTGNRFGVSSMRAK
ncbi:MAG: hypothetical protein R3E12_12520 [Candidatus Eisenbacteria bacterium]|uniref:Right handed beta helix domain-containing protein n=1 Tax=Eiseniibacteriota bacterium TaxID=2212470 RepID=A0A956M1L1_UNCEI|nr:hypothetical protein [Candidatus Eisenbacteria bacterium]